MTGSINCLKLIPDNSTAFLLPRKERVGKVK